MTTAGQITNLFPGFRVFVFGIEVTEDVTSISINFNDSRAPSTAEITLVNQGERSDGVPLWTDRYVTTGADIRALYSDVPNLSEVDLPDVATVLSARAADDQLGWNEALREVFVATSSRTVDVPSNLQEIIREGAAVVETATQSTVADFDRAVTQRIARTIDDRIKSRVLQTKIKERTPVTQPDFRQYGTVKVTNGAQLNALRGEAYRYPLQEGDCIFQSNDPVRIFFRDPRNPSAWYYMFSGFVTDSTDDGDAQGAQMVTLRCEDVLRIFRYARITVNPGIFDIAAVAQIEDTVIRSFYNQDGLTDLSLQEILYTLVFGSDKAGTTELLRLPGNQRLNATRLPFKRVSVNGTSEQQLPADGIGAFDYTRSATFIFGPDPQVVPDVNIRQKQLVDEGLTAEAAKARAARELRKSPGEVSSREVRLRGDNALAVYQSIVDHRVHAGDLETMVLDGETSTNALSLEQDVTTGTATIDAVITEIGENPHRYPVDNGRLIMLLPASLGPETSRSLLLKDIIQSVNTETTFRSKMDMIFEILARIEFSFYASPKGDLLCEMPLYDFEPDDWGDEVVTKKDINRTFQGASVSPEDVGVYFQPGEVRGPFGPAYRIARHDTQSWSRSFTDERVRTVFASTWYVIQGLTTAGTAQTIGQAPAVTVRRALIPQFGARMEQAEPQGFIASKEAAQLYAEVKLNQLNADARSAQYDCLPQIQIFPNRPLLFTIRNFVASVRTIDHRITWGESGDMTMGLGVNYIRGWGGQFRTDDPTKPLYAPIGGFASQPLNYKILFQPTIVKASTAEADGTANSDGTGGDG